jgi:hypothetical protein
MSLPVTGVAAQYLAWGLPRRPEVLPASRLVALSYPASAGGGLVLLGFVLLLTRPGGCPHPAAAGGQPAGPGVHHPGRGGLCRVAGDAVPPRRWGGASAAALGRLGGRAVGAGSGRRPGRLGPAGHGRGHLGAECLGGGAAAAWGCSRSCWRPATPRWCWDWASCSVATPAWSWPGPPWRSRRCSDRPAAASRRSSTAASTDAGTTPPRRSRRSAWLRPQAPPPPGEARLPYAVGLAGLEPATRRL